MNQDLKLVIQFVYYHQTVFFNKFFPVFTKLHFKGFLTVNLFKITGYWEKRNWKKHKNGLFYIWYHFQKIFENKLHDKIFLTF